MKVKFKKLIALAVTLPRPVKIKTVRLYKAFGWPYLFPTTTNCAEELTMKDFSFLLTATV